MASNSDDLAQIASSYDTLPYTSRPFPMTHPARIGAIARLFGLASKPVESARILEIGCAGGENIIPIAFYIPGAEVLGVDIGPKQAADAQAKIAGLGLSNIAVRCECVSELDESQEPFDYIIVHGVYSWVPEFVQDAILGKCRALLAPAGVALVSYNALPGWRMLQPLRDACRVLVPADLAPQERVARSRAIIASFGQRVSGENIYGDLAQFINKRLDQADDAYLFHEFMEDRNEPISFTEFVEAAGRRNLAYLGEAEFPSMLSENFPASMVETATRNAGGNLIAFEQWLDMLNGRSFRQTLLVPVETLAQVRRNLDPSVLTGLHLLANSELRLEREGNAVQVRNSKGRELRSEDGAVATAIESLFAGLPNSISVEACLQGLDETGRAKAADALFRMVIAGMLDVSTTAMAGGKVSDLPVASPYARWDSQAGRPATVNPRHETIMIDSISSLLLPLLDGSREVASLTDALVAAMEAKGMHVTHDGMPVTSAAEMREVLDEAIPRLVRNFEELGLLAG